MAPLIPSLLGSLSRQLSRTLQCAAARCIPAAGASRCASSLTTALGPRVNILPTHFLYTAFRSRLLRWDQQLLSLQPSAGMKTKTALKKRCKDCFFVRRRGRLFVYCKSHPRHKQRQG